MTKEEIKKFEKKVCHIYCNTNLIIGYIEKCIDTPGYNTNGEFIIDSVVYIQSYMILSSNIEKIEITDKITEIFFKLENDL